MKNLKLLGILALVGLVAGVCVYIKKIKDETLYWKTKTYTVDSLYRVDSVRYALQTRKVESLSEENSRLIEEARNLKEYIVSSERIVAEYKRKLSEIESLPADTVIVFFGKEDSLARSFVFNPDSSLYMTGAFQIHEPYGIKIDELSVRTSLSLLLSKNSSGYYVRRIETSTPYLVIKGLDLKVLDEERNKIRYFGGIDFRFPAGSSAGVFVGALRKNLGIKLEAGYFYDKTYAGFGLLYLFN
jgi:hypothetical protein